ncbi:hypothetical protein D3C72_396240 [compost metagenome]
MRVGFVLHRLAGVTAASVLIAGCAAAPAPLASMPQLAFDRTETVVPVGAIAPAPAVVAPALAAAPTAPTAPVALAPVGSGGGGSAAVAVRQLRIDLSAFLAKFQAPAQRRVLATTADIDKLVLTVMQAGQPDQTATLTQAQLASGAADFTFNNLPAGNAIVFVVAYDAAGLPIGSAAQVVVISATSSAVAEMTVQLVPATSTSGPGGTLVTKTTFIDGPAAPLPPSGTVLMELSAYGVPHELTPAPGGGMIVGTHMFNQQQSGNLNTAYMSHVMRLADDGTELFKAAGLGPLPASYAYSTNTDQLWAMWRGARIFKPDGTAIPLAVELNRIALDAAGNAYGVNIIQGTRLVYKVAPTGSATVTSISGQTPVAVDPAGVLWTAWGNTLWRYSANETLLGSQVLSGGIRHTALAPSGEMWVLHEASSDLPANPPVASFSTRLSKLAPNGTVLATYPASGRRLAPDSHGNVWVAGDTLTKLSADGQVLATYPHECWSVAVDNLGYVWIGSKKADGVYVVRKLQP